MGEMLMTVKVDVTPELRTLIDEAYEALGCVHAALFADRNRMESAADKALAILKSVNDGDVHGVAPPIDADGALVDFIREIGFSEIADEWSKTVPRWREMVRVTESLKT